MEYMIQYIIYHPKWVFPITGFLVYQTKSEYPSYSQTRAPLRICYWEAVEGGGSHRDGYSLELTQTWLDQQNSEHKITARYKPNTKYNRRVVESNEFPYWQFEKLRSAQSFKLIRKINFSSDGHCWEVVYLASFNVNWPIPLLPGELNWFSYNTR